MSGAGVRRVLVTRPPHRWPGLAARFSAGPIVVELRPTAVPADPLDASPADRALSVLEGYAFLIVTSATGAEALSKLLTARGRRIPPAVRVAAVGPATARALSAAGLRVDVVSREPRGDGLAREVSARLTAGDRVLLAGAEGGGAAAPALRAAGIAFDEAPLYRIVASPDATALAEDAIAGRFAGVAFTAPSSLELWLDAAGARREVLETALGRLARIAIGPTTAVALSARGLPAHVVAVAPDEAAVGDAIAIALAGGGSGPFAPPSGTGG